MLKKVNEAILRFALLENAKHITVALSGGADSMALLDVLLSLKDELGIKKISAAHFNHLIRGEEALRDQAFVKEQCKARGIELFLGEADVPRYAYDNHLSVELAARRLRYEFFDTLATDVIATAHTASDNIETVIFNLTRGTALSGLCGIPPKRDKFIRPLIFCTRADIEEYCSENNIEYVTDSTNLCDDYTRNKIRHNVVPILKELNKSAETAVTRMSTSIRDDNDFINGIAQTEFDMRYKDCVLNLDKFDAVHISVAKRVIAKYCSQSNIEADNLHINQIYDICLKNGKISLPQDMVATAQNGILKIDFAKKQPAKVEFEVAITAADNNLFEKNENVHNLLLKNVFDCDKIIGKPIVRTRRSGDTIKLKNKNCTKTLKKLFCEYKIPTDKRDDWPVIADDEGIVWVYKIGVAHRCAATDNSKKIFKINVKECF